MKLNLLGTEYEIQDMPETMKGEFDGRIDYDLQVIFIKKNIPIEQQFDVLIHELIHYADYFTQTKLSEAKVTALGNALGAIIRQNIGQLNETIKGEQ